MSCNYAEGLSPYHDKGQLGLEEKFDSKSVVSAKVSLLTKWINEAKHVVIHTGAGISTSAGIPDFRGPRGVWTLEAKGEKPDLNKDFNEAIPTITHMAIVRLVEKGKVKHVVSQNIDGLHLRSNLQRKFLSELHGNMFTEQCSSCNRQFVRSTAVPSVGQKSLNKPCPTLKANGRPCRGRLHDTILDWEHSLPENDLGMADYHSCLSDLSICLGTTMQIVPSGNLPLYTKKHGGKLVIVNLQPTKHNRKADLIIHAYVDEVMTMLMKNLNIKIPKYSPKNDPTRNLSLSPEKFFEWTISDYALRKMKKIYEEKCGTKEARKRLEMIDDDLPLSITKTFKRKGKEDEDSDLEVLDVIVKPKRSREFSKRGSKKNSTPVYNTTITIKKVTPPPKKGKFEGTEKITIKKNVTSTKTKYEIVTKPKKVPKCEIVYSMDGDLCNDLDMICESDDDEMTNNFTYNFRRYLHDDVKKEDIKDEATKEEVMEVKSEVKDEIKVEEEETKKELKEELTEVEEKEAETSEENIDNKTDEEIVAGADKTDEEIVTEKYKTEEEITAGTDKTDEEILAETDKTDEEILAETDKTDEEILAETDKTDEEILAETDKTEDIASMEEDQNIQETSSEKESEASKQESTEVIENVNCESTSTSENFNDEEKVVNPLAEDVDKPENLEAEVEPEKTEAAAKEEKTTTDEPATGEDSRREDEASLPEEITPMEVDAEEPQPVSETEMSLHETELEKLIETTEGEKSKEAGEVESESPEKDKEPAGENMYRNIESELSNLSNSNLESQIDQMVNQAETAPFDEGPLTMPNCNINSTISENYEFYGNEYNSSSNPPDIDYVDNNYYDNNF